LGIPERDLSNAVRSRGHSIGGVTRRIFNVLIAGAFPVIAAHSKPAPFAFFASMMVPQFIMVFFDAETRGAALERMNGRLGTTERKVSRRNM
jgi:MFS transporter, SP family, arabinose:H+ symporter